MKFEALLQGVNAPNPETRLNVVRVLGMVEETRALTVLGERYKVETDATVKQAIQWAGKKIHQASQSGYSTINEVFRFFGIDREIANLVDPREAELLRRMQTSMDNAMIKSQQDAASRRITTATAMGIGATLIAGPLTGGLVMGSAMSGGIDASSSNMGPLREALSNKRTPPPVPADVNITIWAKRLLEDPNRENRKNAAIELANFNNPLALPHLATALINDMDPVVREAAERYGKVLYWKMIYWEMEQDGTLEQEFKARAKAAGKDFEEQAQASGDGTGPLAPSKSQPPPMPEANKSDIAQILARAEAEKAKRKKR